MLFFLTAVVLLALVVLALFLEPLVRRVRGAGAERRRSEPGRNRLAELKAKRRRGEIEEAEYLERVQALDMHVAEDRRDRE